MKVTCKTLHGSAFQVECEPSETVATLKQKVHAANTALPVEHLVTVFQGKVLVDTATLAESGVSETGFVVVMVKKPAVAGARDSDPLLRTGSCLLPAAPAAASAAAQ